MAESADFPDIDSDGDYDTDTVSVTSTRPSGSEQEYIVEALLAEKLEAAGITMYLIKWENFPLYSSTWEPESGLYGTGLVELWETRKKRMGSKAWQEFNQRQQLRFQEARRKRKAKRQRKRKRAAAQQAANQSGSDAPLPLRRRSVPTVSAKKDSKGTIEAARGSSSRTKSHPRKLPRSQSPNSPDSEKSEAEDSMVEDIQRNQRQLERMTKRRGNQLFLSDDEEVDGSNAHTSSIKGVAANRGAQISPKQGETSANKTPAPRSTKEKPVMAEAAHSSHPKRSNASTTTVPRKSVGAAKSKNGRAPVAIRRSAVAPIKFVNQPSTTSRKEWTSGDSLYKTAMFRRKAELRSRNEKAPDESELHFVNAPPGGIPTPVAPRRTETRKTEDVYGRRDTGRRQRESTDVAPAPPPPPPEPLPNKIPLMCFEWRNGSCPYSADRCQFHHRDGFPPSPHDGSVPGKYRTPALTCFHWLRNPHGCNKTEEECYFAHRNTGTLSVIGKGPETIDASERPRRSTSLTCFYWLRDERGCHKTSQACSFAHENTGWLASPFGPNKIPERIDLSERPRSQLNIPGQHQNPPLTCYDWLRSESGCYRSDEDCFCAHRNTGFIQSNIFGIESIDPSEQPRNLPGKYRTPPLTCYNWLRSKDGCLKSDEECSCVHKNTGWLPIPDGPTETIDSLEQPLSRTMDPDGTVKGKFRTPPLTCWDWLRAKESCHKSDEDCSFAHKNTGWLSRLDGSTDCINPTEPQRCTIRLETTRIDNNRDPSGPPKDQRRRSQQLETVPFKRKEELTCYFWQNHSCKNGERCKFAHYETGTTAFLPGSKRNSYADGDTHEGANFIGAPNRDLQQARRTSVKEGPQQGAAILHLTPSETESRATLSSAELRDLIGSSCKLNFEELITYEDELLDRRALVIFHPLDHHKECELITRWLLLHHVEVHNFWFDGAWDTFNHAIMDNGTGAVLVHPDFQNFEDVPGFGQVLKRKVNVWSVGRQASFEYDSQVSTRLPEFKQDCISIFPHGGIIYVTDDVFEKKPQEALRIIELFIDKIEQCRRVAGPTDPWKKVDDGCLLWRIATRPELMNSIFQACEAHEAEIDANDPVQVSRVKLYEILSKTNYVEQDIEDAPFIARADDYFPIMSERRQVMEPYFEALDRSQDEANKSMVGLYAEVILDLRKSYRQYLVVHTEPTKVDWQSRWQHIGEIMTPEKCIEYFQQPPKDCRFNFYEWAFPEKKNMKD
ncbi:hypothetical protein BDV96DRAFT_563903 [Lophiotrema nucula]|uniref:Chromo domain-containing protein n=1 Tax=Lophiotrema nucula TaxID=690887 RepID=A0A6A5ZNM9_9PLEO|nr:hypothetical protein BDV96DRAFT_563903 [Lophiotrema nucula]